MATSKTGTGGTAEIIRYRERIGTAAILAVTAWFLYVVKALPFALEQFNGIESVAWKAVIAMSSVAVAVFAVTSAGDIGRFVRPFLRRLINYVTPVLPADVTSERLREVKKKLAALDLRVAEVVMLRAGHETEISKLKAEQANILREAQGGFYGSSDSALARQLNRNQEALARREAQLEEARANEDMLLDAREICDVCVQRLEASRDRYRASLEIARTITGVRALAGSGGSERGEDPAEAAEAQCMNELTEVDFLMANLEVSLYDQRLGDRVAALRIAELRQKPVETTGVRVDHEGTAGEAVEVDLVGSTKSAGARQDRKNRR